MPSKGRPPEEDRIKGLSERVPESVSKTKSSQKDEKVENKEFKSLAEWEEDLELYFDEVVTFFIFEMK